MQQNGGDENPITFFPIGTIHSPFHDIAGMPIQPNGARGERGTVEIADRFAGGLKDLDGFARIILIYSFHKCTGHDLHVKPFLDPAHRGIFATRSPRRPNAIGLSVVRLVSVNGSTLVVDDVDVLDGTPLLDIKPYVPAFDAYPDSCCGWLESVAKNAESVRSDGRFR
ncbi:tRNA (N6-threonylcarbamoyladenosine(37)-N6)-methyltransferase TrmO [uncultured Methanoregula sp.]|uniref:tRNA (N6-threonylcarbamoyladenosine(37)-N6)-methyltransferase TrmO n=1 Tax=uncultured Methanoregula sp. TaxID=1005933 RepID=UPI002AAB4DB6|nr:tRNA (N6-threonylcarbamoyladenosine(37)-N6)-methyltransferase TrmO [uncultured Methanoregula sp.]